MIGYTRNLPEFLERTEAQDPDYPVGWAQEIAAHDVREYARVLVETRVPKIDNWRMLQLIAFFWEILQPNLLLLPADPADIQWAKRVFDYAEQKMNWIYSADSVAVFKNYAPEEDSEWSKL